MLLQTNSYIVPKDKRSEHARLVRRFRQTLARIGCDHFEVYEQVGANWSGGETTGRYVQIMRFRDRKHQLQVQQSERTDPAAQGLIEEFCQLINFPYQQQQGLFAVGFYQSTLPVAQSRGGEPGPPTPGDGPVFNEGSTDVTADNVPTVDGAGVTAGAVADLWESAVDPEPLETPASLAPEAPAADAGDELTPLELDLDATEFEIPDDEPPGGAGMSNELPEISVDETDAGEPTDVSAGLVDSADLTDRADLSDPWTPEANADEPGAELVAAPADPDSPGEAEGGQVVDDLAVEGPDVLEVPSDVGDEAVESDYGPRDGLPTVDELQEPADEFDLLDLTGDPDAEDTAYALDLESAPEEDPGRPGIHGDAHAPPDSSRNNGDAHRAGRHG